MFTSVIHRDLNFVTVPIVNEVGDRGVSLPLILTSPGCTQIKLTIARARIRANFIHKYFLPRDVVTLIRTFKVKDHDKSVLRVHGLLIIF